MLVSPRYLNNTIYQKTNKPNAYVTNNEKSSDLKMLNNLYYPLFKQNNFQKYANQINRYNNLHGNVLKQLGLKQRIEYLHKLFENSEVIDDCFLIFLHFKKLVENSDIKTIAQKFPEKIGESDLKYLIKDKIPLTSLDDSAMLEHRLICQKARPYTTKDDEYKNNIEHILNHELGLVENAKNDRKLVIVTGLPASGKSQFIKDNYDTQDYYLGDVDKIKELFPAYKDNAEKYNTLHDISRYIFHQQILPVVIPKGKNIIIPTTGLAEYIERLAKPAKAYGYQVKLLHITIPKDVAMKNVVKRFNETKRFIDPFFVARRAPFMETLTSELKKTPLIDEITVMESKIK